MSSSAWCDLNSKGDIIKLHGKCPNPKCNCQKIITLTPQQFMLEGGSIKSKLQKNFRGTQTAGYIFLKPAINATAPFVGCFSKDKEFKGRTSSCYYIKINFRW